MAFSISCPHCGEAYRFAEKPNRTRFRCRECEESIELDDVAPQTPIPPVKKTAPPPVPVRKPENSAASPRKRPVEDDEPEEETPKPRRRLTSDDDDDRPRSRRRPVDDDVRPAARSELRRRSRRNEDDDDDYAPPGRKSGNGLVVVICLIALIGLGGIAAVGVYFFQAKNRIDDAIALEANGNANVPVGGNPFGGVPPVGPLDDEDFVPNMGMPRPVPGNPANNRPRPNNPRGPGGAVAQQPWAAPIDAGPKVDFKPGNWSAPMRNVDKLFLPDGHSKFVAIGFEGGGNQTRAIYNIEDGNQIGSFSGDLSGFQQYFTMSDDGRFLASTFMNKLKILNRDKPGQVLDVQANKRIDWVVFDRESKSFYAAEMRNFKHFIGQYSIDGQLLKEFPREVDGFMMGRGALSPGGKHLVVREKSVLSIYETATGRYLGSTANPQQGVFPSTCQGLRYTPDGTRIIAVFSEANQAQCRIMNATTGKTEVTFACPASNHVRIGVSADGKTIQIGPKWFDASGKEIPALGQKSEISQDLPALMGDAVFSMTGNLGNTQLQCEPK